MDAPPFCSVLNMKSCCNERPARRLRSRPSRKTGLSFSIPAGPPDCPKGPLFHMASTDHGLATLLRGGTVAVVDGFQIEPLLSVLQRLRIGWFVLIPGMI